MSPAAKKAEQLRQAQKLARELSDEKTYKVSYSGLQNLLTNTLKSNVVGLINPKLAEHAENFFNKVDKPQAIYTDTRKQEVPQEVVITPDDSAVKKPWFERSAI